MDQINRLYILKKASPELMEFLKKSITEEGVNITTYPEAMGKHLFILKRFFELFKNGAKIYIPVHIIFFLLRLKRSKDPFHISLWKALRGWLKSCVFAALFATSYPFTGTYFNTLVGPMTSFKVWIMSGIFAITILFETPSRWCEMSIYVLANWLEGQTTNYKKNRVGPSIPHFAKLMLALSFGIISKCYFQSGPMSRKFRFILNRIIGDREDFGIVDKEKKGKNVAEE